EQCKNPTHPATAVPSTNGHNALELLRPKRERQTLSPSTGFLTTGRHPQEETRTSSANSEEADPACHVPILTTHANYIANGTPREKPQVISQVHLLQKCLKDSRKQAMVKAFHPVYHALTIIEGINPPSSDFHESHDRTSSSGSFPLYYFSYDHLFFLPLKDTHLYQFFTLICIGYQSHHKMSGLALPHAPCHDRRHHYKPRAMGSLTMD
ncbi:hypothetical protein H1C71_023041, partial [Ictidomys tridecemlineatus]